MIVACAAAMAVAPLVRDGGVLAVVGAARYRGVRGVWDGQTRLLLEGAIGVVVSAILLATAAASRFG